jgi:hypothetical protein
MATRTCGPFGCDTCSAAPAKHFAPVDERMFHAWTGFTLLINHESLTPASWPAASVKNSDAGSFQAAQAITTATGGRVAWRAD